MSLSANVETINEIEARIYEFYSNRNDGSYPQGYCDQIAIDIYCGLSAHGIASHIVARYQIVNGNSRPHWWVILNSGEYIDPMSKNLIESGDSVRHMILHNNPNMLKGIVTQYGNWL